MTELKAADDAIEVVLLLTEYSGPVTGSLSVSGPLSRPQL
jgi:hypothetical protein